MFKEALLLGPIGDQSQTASKNSTEWLSHSISTRKNICGQWRHTYD